MDIDVFLCRIEPQDYETAMALSPKLSPTDQARAARFMFDRDRASFIVAHVLFETFVPPRLRQSPWDLKTNRFGKPMIVPNPDGVHFNLSHTTGMVALAIANGTEVGVDVERVRIEKSYDDIHGRVLTPAEIDEVEAQADPHDAFIKMWAAKEAILKAMGTGLSVPAKDLEFLNDQVTKIPAEFGRPDQWCVQTETHAGWWSAVAAKTPQIVKKQVFVELSALA